MARMGGDVNGYEDTLKGSGDDSKIMPVACAGTCNESDMYRFACTVQVDSFKALNATDQEHHPAGTHKGSINRPELMS